MIDRLIIMLERGEPTFFDLIDRVVQAAKDGVLVVNTIRTTEVSAEDVDGYLIKCAYADDSVDEIKEYIDWVKSLYTKTFVIESREDMYRIGDEYEIVLSNGEDIGSIVTISDDTPYFEYDGRLTPVPYAVLKGATVTQTRGNQCNK